mgnify:CR=1 FL=1
MNRILKRPMFRMGGSTREEFNKGIITDLEKRYVKEEEEKANGGRIGYDNGGGVEPINRSESIRRRVGTYRDLYDELPNVQSPLASGSLNNFLINFGLDLASRSPQGGLISTAALSAKEPFQKFEKTSQAEQNLLRQVGLESATMDIGAETAAAAAALKEKSAMKRLTTDIQAKKDLYDLERKDSVDTLIKTAAVDGLIQNGGMYNNLNTSTNAANWVFKESTEYKDKNIGGIISQNDLKRPEAFAKKQGKKQGVGTVYYDPYSDRVLEIQKNDEGDFVLVPVSSLSSVPDKNIEATTELGDASPKIKKVGTDTVIDKISPKDTGFANKPMFESIDEIKSVLRQPMTGKEIKENYDINFPVNLYTTYSPNS